MIETLFYYAALFAEYAGCAVALSLIGWLLAHWVHTPKMNDAARMATLLWSSGIRSSRVRQFGDSQWSMLACAANVRCPSAETRERTIHWLEQYETQQKARVA